MERPTFNAAKVPLAVFAAALLLLCGCSSADIGEVRRAALSSDGKYCATVHRMHDRLLLTLLNVDEGSITQREVGASELAWLPESHSLLSVIIHKGDKRVALFEAPDLERPRYLSQRPAQLFQLHQGKAFYTTAIEDRTDIVAIDLAGLTESIETSVGSKVCGFAVHSEGFLCAAPVAEISTAEDGIGRTIREMAATRSFEDLRVQPLLTAGDIVEFPTNCTVMFVAKDKPAKALLPSVLWEPRCRLVMGGSGGHFCIEADPVRAFELVRNKEKEILEAKELAPPPGRFEHVCGAPTGFILADRFSTITWTPGRKPGQSKPTWPYEVSSLQSETPWGPLITTRAGALPARHVVLLSSSGNRLLDSSGWLMREMRDWLISRDLMAEAATISPSVLPEFPGEFSKADSPEFAAFHPRLPVAEFALAKGDVKRCIELYSREGTAFAVRIAEIHIAHGSDKAEVAAWLARASNPSMRSRADLLLRLFNKAPSSLLKGWAAANRSWDSGDWAEFAKESQRYLDGMDDACFDPALVGKVLRFARAMGDDKTLRNCLKTIQEQSNGPFAAECEAILADFADLANDGEMKGKALLALSGLREDEEIALLNQVVLNALDTGKGIEEAKAAAKRLLEFRLPTDDAIKLRLRLAALFGLIEKNVNTAAEQANHLAWAAYGDSALAFESAAWSTYILDSLSPEAATSVLVRFLKSPRKAVRDAAPEIAAWGLRSGIARIPVEEMRGTELPIWFSDRLRALLEVPELVGKVDEKVLSFLSAEEGEIAEIEGFVGNRRPDTLSETLRMLAVFRIVARKIDDSGNWAVPIPSLSRDRRSLATLEFRLPDLIEAAQGEEGPLIAALRAALDPRLFAEDTSLAVVCGRAVLTEFAATPWGAAGQAGPGKGTALTAVVLSGPSESLINFLSVYRGRPVCIPVFERALEVFSAKGRVGDCVRALRLSVSSDSAEVRNAALDCLCSAMLLTGEKAELEKLCEELSKTGVSSGRFKNGPDYAMLMAEAAERNGNAKTRMEWLVEWLDRGGHLSLTPGEMMEFLKANEGILEMWARKRAYAVAAWISMMPVEYRSSLLEQCGGMAEEVKKLMAGE
ncbi:MAG: hypothetical protein Kow00107_07190 [Planctomycetota bacterium]